MDRYPYHWYIILLGAMRALAHIGVHFTHRIFGLSVLGVKIFRDRSKRLLALSQKTYIQKMLRRYHMHDCKPMDTSIEKNLSLSLDMCPKTPNEKEQMFKVPYSNVVSSLMSAMMCTCLDICYVVGLVSRFQFNLGQKH